MIPLIAKLQSLTRREENKELIIHSLLSIVVRIGGAVATFFMNVIVARYLGTEESGYFFLAVTVTTMLATIGRIGADLTVLRFVSIHSEAGEWNKVHGILSIFMRWTILPVSALTTLVCVFAKPIAVYFFHKEAFQWPLFFTALSMPFFAAYNIHAMALQARRKVWLSVTSLGILTPAFLIVLIVGLSPHNSISTGIYYLVACIANLLLVYYWWTTSVPPANGEKTFDKKLLWKSCSALWIIVSMQQFILWGGHLIAGIFNSPEEVAQLAVSRTTASLISFVLSAVNIVSAPRFASMYSRGEMNKLKNYARNTTRLMTFVALPITLAIWLFPSLIMSLFGKGFIGGTWLLRILALGQFINVATGSVGYLLTMSGHEKELKKIRILNAVLAIALALILNPLFGAIGSALATALALASSNLMAVRLVRKRLGFSTLSILGFK